MNSCHSKRHVLILTFNGGSYHRQAARTLLNELTQRPSLDVKIIDYEKHDLLVRFAAGVFNFVGAYNPIWVTNLISPLLWKRGANEQGNTEDMITRLQHRYQDNCLKKLVEEERADLVVWTFAPGNGITRCPRPAMAVVADWFGSCSPDWAASYVDCLWCPSQRSAEYLLATGLLRQEQIVIGDPLFPNCRPRNDPTSTSEKKALKERLGLDPERHLVLFNTGRRNQIFKTLAEPSPCMGRLQVVVLCYNRNDMKRAVQRTQHYTQAQLIATAWTDQISDYLLASDMVITKPGAGMTGEALASKASIVFDCRGGVMIQEREMMEYSLANDYARIAHSNEELRGFIRQLAEQGPYCPEGLQKAKFTNGLEAICDRIEQLAHEARSI